MKYFQRWILHPFLISLYPALFLLANNLHYLEPVSSLRTLLVIIVLSNFLLLFMFLLIRHFYKSALVTSSIFFMFFFYGHFRSVLLSNGLSKIPLINHKFLIPIWFAMLSLVIWWIIRRAKNILDLTAFMNIISIALITLVTIQGILYRNTEIPRGKQLGVKSFADQLIPPPVGQRPDIYYIILDGYPSTRLLKEAYKIDNTGFIDELIKRGFFIAQCARSNYPNTSYSMASSLNFDYIPPVGEQFLEKGHTWRSFGPYVHENSVKETFRDLGYKTVTFDSYYQWLNTPESDIFITSRNDHDLLLGQIKNLFLGNLNEYEEMLVNTTPFVRWKTVLGKVKQALGRSTTNIIGSEEMEVKGTMNLGEQKILYEIYNNNLEKLPTISSIHGPKFIYAHLLTTHQPFLFAKDGGFSPDQSIDGYRSSIEFTNQSILNSIDTILKNSKIPPVIIIQGDHSLTGTEDAFGILNAYYLPGDASKNLYPQISPVNTFRVIFNSYFGGNFPLFEDKSYWIHDFQGRLSPEMVPPVNTCE